MQAAVLERRLADKSEDLVHASMVRADLEVVIAREEDGACILAQRQKVNHGIASWRTLPDASWLHAACVPTIGTDLCAQDLASMHMQAQLLEQAAHAAAGLSGAIADNLSQKRQLREALVAAAGCCSETLLDAHLQRLR